MAIATTIFNRGTGIGNICFDRDHNQIFATNMEDGRIYRIRASTGAVLSRYDPNKPYVDNLGASTIQGSFEELQERHWGIAYHNDKLYFSRWNDNYHASNSDPAYMNRHNEIYAVNIRHVAGEFDISYPHPTPETFIDDPSNPEQPIITIPFIVNTSGGTHPYSSPVADIEISADGRSILLGERTMSDAYHHTISDPIPFINQNPVLAWAHKSRVLRYDLSPCSEWELAQLYQVGNVHQTDYQKANCAGGVDFDLNNDDNLLSRIWSTGDALIYGNFGACAPPVSQYVYGITGIPLAGNTTGTVCPTSIYMHIFGTGNAITNLTDLGLADLKTDPGDVDIFRFTPCVFSGELTESIGSLCECNSSVKVEEDDLQGSAPYSYLWSNGSTSPEINDLCAGNGYRVTVTDGEGCLYIDDFCIPENPLETLDLELNGCIGGDNASIGITGLSEGGEYTYLWSTGETTSTISGVSAGTYSVTVTDANGCSGVASINLHPFSAAIQFNFVNRIKCHGDCNGALTAVPSYGVGPYTYAWSSVGRPGFSASTQYIDGLCEGTYNLTITDANGCTSTATHTLSEPEELVSTIGGTHVTCFSSCNGEAIVAVVGGTGVYAYLWSNGSTAATISNLCAGTYNVTVTDAAGCTATDAVTVTELGRMTVNTIMNYADKLKCDGACNGKIDAWIQHGGVAPFVYQWSMDGTPFSTSSTISDLCEGLYSVTVKDANGCTASASRTLSRPNPISITPTVIDATCEESDGSITLTVTGGAPVTIPGMDGYSYTWSNGSTTKDLSNIGPGTYTVTVSTTDYCEGVATITVGGPAPLVGNISISQNTICVGEEGYMHLFLEGEGFAQFTNDGVVDAIFPYSGTVNHYEPIGTRPDEIGVHEICLTLYSANPEETNDYCSKTICITGELKNCGCDKLEGNAEIEAVPGIDMKYEFSNVGWVTATYINWFVDGVLIEQTTGEGIFSHQFTQGHHTVCMDAAYVLTNEDGTTTCCVVRDCMDIDFDLCEYLQSTDGISYTLDPNNYHNATFTFTGSTNPTVPTVIWDFGDGMVEVNNGQNTTHHYIDNNNGLGYEACATVIWTRNGTVFDPNADDLEVCCCVDEICIPVEIDPCAAITLDIAVRADLEQQVVFEAVPSVPIPSASYTWSINNVPYFGAGAFLINSEPYTGPYTICAEATYVTNLPNEQPVTCTIEVCEEYYRSQQAMIKENGLLRYYPNPTNGVLIVEIEANENDVAKLELTSNIGERLLTKEYEKMKEGVNQLLIDISELPSGLYLMKATISNKVEIVKVIKE